VGVVDSPTNLDEIYGVDVLENLDRIKVDAVAGELFPIQQVFNSFLRHPSFLLTS
jgi:hypothetical protein